MKNIFTTSRILFPVFVMAILFAEFSYSQTYIDVAPGFGTLNDAVSSNTNPDAIFRLQRGDAAIYLLNGSVSNTIPLHIEAAPGSGAIPKLIPGVSTSGSSDIAFRLHADVFLKNVYVTAMDAAGAMKTQILRDMADSIKIFADSCFFENSAQSFIRTDNELADIHITNSTIRNCLGDYANGRGIDDRGNNMDTLYLENNTFYNISSRVLRDGGGWINYAYINHNTFVNLGKYIMSIGECPNVVFTNNLAIDCGFLGKNQSSTQALVEVDPLISADYLGRKQTVEAHNNNFAFNSTFNSHYPDTVIAVTNFNENMIAAMDSSGFDTTNFSEFVQFKTSLPDVDTIITNYWKAEGNDAYSASGLYVTGNYDFSYPETSKSYTGGMNGKPVGAVTWFDMVLAVDNKTDRVVPNGFSLLQNYPNPFNPETVIEYNIPKRADVKLVVYNSLGQAVKTLVNGNETSGFHTVSWNGRNESGQSLSSGIYFYRLQAIDKSGQAGNFSSTKKMILIK